MAILKYKINGEWVELGGSASGGAEVDATLTQEGKAADAKVVGDTVNALGEAVSNAVTNEALGEVVGALSESIGNVEAEVDKKQNKIIFNATQPADWVNGDVWLKPAE